MKIASIKNYNGIFNTNFSFKSDEKQSLKSEQDIYIKRFVKDSFERRNPSIINNATNNIVKEFQDKIIGKIYSSPRLTTIDKQVKVLDEIADAYIRDCQFDKATAITLHTMNKVYQDKSITDNEKKQKILSDNHIYILKRFLDTSRLDNPLRKNVVDMICEMNYKEFLPIAEKILSFDPRPFEVENTEYTKPLRKFINSYYNLDNLSSFINKNDYYTEGMCKVLEEWGFPKHIKYLTTVLNSYSCHDWSKAQAIRAIGYIGGSEAEKILKQYANIKHGDERSALFREYAIQYLDRSGVSAASHNFIRGLYNNYGSIKEHKKFYSAYFAIVNALARYNDPEDVLLLEKNLHNPEHKIVRDTISAIGKIQCQKSSQCLLSYLGTNPTNKYTFWGEPDIDLLTPLAEALSKQKLTNSEAIFAKKKLRYLANQEKKIYDLTINNYINAIGADNNDVLSSKYENNIWQQIYKNKYIVGPKYKLLDPLIRYTSYNDLPYLIKKIKLDPDEIYDFGLDVPDLLGKIGRNTDIHNYLNNDDVSPEKLKSLIVSSNYFINYEPELLQLATKKSPILAAKYSMAKEQTQADYFKNGSSYNDDNVTFARIIVRGNLKWQ